MSQKQITTVTVQVVLLYPRKKAEHRTTLQRDSSTQQLLKEVSTAVTLPQSSTLILGSCDPEQGFREYTEKSMGGLIAQLDDVGCIVALEVPAKENPSCFDVLVNVGYPQLKYNNKWAFAPYHLPVVRRLLRLCNYDQIYEAVYKCLEDDCPTLCNPDTHAETFSVLPKPCSTSMPDTRRKEIKSNDTATTSYVTDSVGNTGQNVGAGSASGTSVKHSVPWWIWTTEQDDMEQEARESWRLAGKCYPLVEKGRNPLCNWLWRNKHYYFRLYRCNDPSEYLPNTGLPIPGWSKGLNHLWLQFHPLYARHALQQQ